MYIQPYPENESNNQSIIRIIKNELKLNVKKLYRMEKKGAVKIWRAELARGKSLRIDNRAVGNSVYLQKLALKNGVNVPRVLYYKNIKISTWVNGEMLSNVFDDANAFIEVGRQLAKMNSIVDPSTGRCLTNSDMGITNFIYTKNKQIYIIDMNTMRLTRNPDSSICKMLLKRIRDPERNALILKGYGETRDTKKIIKAAEKLNWKWGHRGFRKNTSPCA